MPPVTQARSAEPANGPSMRACFGVGCAHHHRCARYAAVARSEASSTTLGTCVSGGVYPMFIELHASR